MSYAVIHMQKLKKSAVKGMQIHNQREKESQTNPDIDSTRLHLNYDLVNPEPIDYNQKINQMIEEGVTTGKAIRKDAVLIASFMVTSDKEFFDSLSGPEEERFFKSAYEFLCNEYGEKNIAYASVHKDEKTPHMHVGFVPITEDGRLSAKDFFGKKSQLVKLQDNFHEHLREAGFDLERGLSSSKKHLETAKFKAVTSQQLEREAKENYEKLVDQIQKIDGSTKEIEEIERKKLPLGFVGLKEGDYEFLLQKAQESALYEAEARFLEDELKKSNEENKVLKSEMQSGQDAVRNQYKNIEVENEQLKADLDRVAEQKAQEILQESLDTQALQFRMKYNELVQKHNKVAELAREKLEENKHLKHEVKSLEEVNMELNTEIQTLQGKIKEYVQQLELTASRFLRFVESIPKTIHREVIDKVKGVLKVHNVDKEVIQTIEDKREKLIENAVNEARDSVLQKETKQSLER